MADPPLAGTVLLPFSAKTEPALRQLAGRLASRIEGEPELDLDDVAYSLVKTRASFEQRAAVVGEGREEVIAGLRALARGESPAAAAGGRARTSAKVAFLFSGHGSQWEGMGLELFRRSPVFAGKLRECEEALSPHVDWSVEGVLRGAPGAPALGPSAWCSR